MSEVDEPAEEHIVSTPPPPQSQRPLIIQRNGRYFCVTRYYATNGGTVLSEEMWDITDQLQELVEASAMAWISPANRMN